jgi:hypothetical protein
MEYIIDPKSVSFEDVQADLLSHADAQPDSEKWDVFFQSSGGYQVIEYISALRAILSYDNIVARRENFIQFSKNRSSKIGTSQFLGYSAFRGRNAIIDVTYTPAYSGILPAYYIIGTVKEVDLIILEETPINAGVEITIRCMIGEIGEEEQIATSNGLGLFKFRTPNVSDEVKVFIDNVEVSTTTEVVELLEGFAQVQTNPFGSVDVKYLNFPAFPVVFNTGGIIKIIFVKRKDVDFLLSDLSLDEVEGVLVSIVINEIYQEIETDLSIEINAPLRNETKLHVRGRRDDGKVIRQLDPSMIDAKSKDVTGVAAVMEIYYLRAGEVRYTPAEKDELIVKFEPYRPNGLLPPIVLEPSRAVRTFKVTIYRVEKTTGDITGTIDAIFSQYEYKLGVTINIHDIEAQLESYSFIKVARIEYVSSPWEALKGYEIGAQVIPTVANGKAYEVFKHILKSGSVEPVWPTVGADITIDNDIMWQTYIKSDTTEIPAWEADTEYSFDMRVKPVGAQTGFAQKVIGFVNYSGNVEPTWPVLGSLTVEEFTGTLTYDKNIIYRALPLEDTPPDWLANNIYQGGETIVPTDPIASDNVGVMWQVFGFVRSTGNVEPTWPTVLGNTVTDGSVVWTTKDPKEVEVTLDKSQYTVITKQTTIE